ncbi:PRPF38B, partial [Symbiodinium necroappetens]
EACGGEPSRARMPSQAGHCRGDRRGGGVATWQRAGAERQRPLASESDGPAAGRQHHHSAPGEGDTDRRRSRVVSPPRRVTGLVQVQGQIGVCPSARTSRSRQGGSCLWQRSAPPAAGFLDCKDYAKRPQAFEVGLAKRREQGSAESQMQQEDTTHARQKRRSDKDADADRESKMLRRSTDEEKERQRYSKQIFEKYGQVRTRPSAGTAQDDDVDRIQLG